MWMHIDAAYAGSAFICPEFRPLLNGVEVCLNIETLTFMQHNIITQLVLAKVIERHLVSVTGSLQELSLEKCHDGTQTYSEH